MAEVAKPRPIKPKKPPSDDPDPPGLLRKPNSSLAHVNSDGREGNNGMLRSGRARVYEYQSSCNAAYGTFPCVEFRSFRVSHASSLGKWQCGTALQQPKSTPHLTVYNNVLTPRSFHSSLNQAVQHFKSGSRALRRQGDGPKLEDGARLTHRERGLSLSRTSPNRSNLACKHIMP